MKRYLLLAWLCWGLLLFPSQARAEQPSVLEIAPEHTLLDTAAALSYFEDPSGQLKYNDIAQYAAEFKPSKGTSLGFGFTKSAYWVKLSYRSPLDLNGHLLELVNPLMDSIDLYYPRRDGLPGHTHLGRELPFAQRALEHRHFLIPMAEMAPEGTLVFRFQSESAMQIQLFVHRERDFWAQDQFKLGAQVLFVGILVAMMLYNLLLGFSLWDKTYFYYIFYLVSAGLFLCSLNGLNYQFLWREAVAWNKVSSPVLLALTNLSLVAFAAVFLKLKAYSLRLHQLFLGLMGVSLLGLVGAFLLPYALMGKLLVLFVLISSISSIWAGLVILRKGYHPAKIYLIAWSMMLLGSFLLALSRLGWLPLHFLTQNTAQIGVSLEAILLSFALADRIKLLQREKELALFKASVDPLTQLFNRGKMLELVQAEQAPFSLVIFDIDFFKKINDTFGHGVGDEVLVKVAWTVKHALRPQDSVARWGGEEFVLLLPGSDLLAAEAQAEALRQKIAALHFESIGRPVTVSMGVATYKSNDSFESLLERADARLYKAKLAGRNQVVAS
ncbi:MAG: hypothetical protein CVV27_10230 [Candidatus Melainabacteria bacterium HGW-Melainabacteria-1]|nr:MAG: hypothetical protein CVV27_10230 [Candidatus Melainabacteria bacterium HGW-Melainabacteria-1]